MDTETPHCPFPGWAPSILMAILLPPGRRPGIPLQEPTQQEVPTGDTWPRAKPLAHAFLNYRQVAKNKRHLSEEEKLREEEEKEKERLSEMDKIQLAKIGRAHV